MAGTLFLKVDHWSGGKLIPEISGKEKECIQFRNFNPVNKQSKKNIISPFRRDKPNFNKE